MKHERIVIVGASIAGATAAATLRAEGWTGALTVIGDEPVEPYSRVPLSKGVLAGTQDTGTASLPALPDDVELRLGSAAVGLRTGAQQVLLADGSVVNFDGLVIATGARARRLAMVGQDGELVVRDLQDAARIAKRLPGASSAIVVGGGFLGMEVSSTLRQRGMTVMIVDKEPPLQRTLGPWLSEYIRAAAEESGVRMSLSAGNVALYGYPVSGVLTGEERIETADLVISAAGDIPNTEWLEGSGLRIANGVVVDEYCRISPRIVAAGDVVSREVAPGVFRRTPHWSNAVAQARAAAVSLLRVDAPAFAPDHYFWTEQFGLDVKIVGELPLLGVPEVVDGDLALRTVLLRWSNGGRTSAVVAVNYRMPAARLRALKSASPSAGAPVSPASDTDGGVRRPT